jgi:hypothetical protein
MSAITDPDTIGLFRLKVLSKGLGLEIRGMIKAAPTCYTVVKREFGFVGSKQRVLEQLNAYISNKEKELGYNNA